MYYLVKLLQYEVLQEESILDKTKSKLIKEILNAEKIDSLPFFLVGEITKSTFVIREDVTESLIHRNVKEI